MTVQINFLLSISSIDRPVDSKAPDLYYMISDKWPSKIMEIELIDWNLPCTFIVNVDTLRESNKLICTPDTYTFPFIDKLSSTNGLSYLNYVSKGQAGRGTLITRGDRV